MYLFTTGVISMCDVEIIFTRQCLTTTTDHTGTHFPYSTLPLLKWFPFSLLFRNEVDRYVHQLKKRKVGCRIPKQVG